MHGRKYNHNKIFAANDGVKVVQGPSKSGGWRGTLVIDRPGHRRDVSASASASYAPPVVALTRSTYNMYIQFSVHDIIIFYLLGLLIKTW